MKFAADVNLRFADDDALLKFEPKLDNGMGGGVWPRTDRQGNPIRSWDSAHQRAMNEIARRLRSTKDSAEPFELGRIGRRSREYLRDCAACFAIHFIYMDAMQDDNPFLQSRAEYYWRYAGTMLEAEAEQLDYDIDNSGTIEEIEKNQPFNSRVIRG